MSVSLQHSCHVFLLVLLFLSTDTQAHKNISLGSSITAGLCDVCYWKSPLGDFAFGFRKVNSDGYLVAIWFNNVPENPIVWSGNRNNLVRAGSTLELNNFGWLVINDSSGKTIWISAINAIGVHHAALLDTGNLVLVGSDSVILWESFHQPTDTMLPSQTLDIGQELIARYSEQNYSDGRFKFILQPDGNLLLYTTKYPFNNPRTAYWGTFTVVSGYQVIYNHSGYMNLVARNGSLLNSIFSDSVPAEDFYQRATIDHDGVFRLYTYPKKATSLSESLNTWRTLSFIPSNICTAVIEVIGSGSCGLNSYCTFDAGKPSCECPPGYILLDPNDKNKGCKQNFVSHSCNEAMNDSDNYEFIEMSNTDWAFSDYEDFEFVPEDWCKQSCLEDCHCGLILYRNDEHCYKKKVPMSNGRTDPSITGKTFIKVRKENNSTLPASGSEKKGLETAVFIELLVFGSSAFLNIAFLVATLVFLFNRNRQRQKMLQSLQLKPGINLRSFTFNELEAATGKFKEELGSGNFGTVYKAILENGECVAVKKSDKMASVAEQEFQTEVCTIGRTNHKNLVKLLGFCNEEKHRLLVYEYMSNGCLANHLFRTSRLNYFTRLQIALDVARGILYLHQECNLHIIHCDIKPQNILLDESLTAKISDFGQAKLLKIDKIRSTTVIRGTRGYVAPEWFLNMPITAKVDVYSFGILLLQLICCRQRLLTNENDTKEASLADWAYECYKEGKLQVLVEGDEEAMNDMLKLEKNVMVAMWCIQEDPSIRPTMKGVIHMLEGVVQVPVPPRPYSYFAQSNQNKFW